MLGRTEAWLEAEVDRFLKKGIWKRSLDDCCGDVGGETLDEDWGGKLNDRPSSGAIDGFDSVVSEPTPDRTGRSPFCISPKYSLSTSVLRCAQLRRKRRPSSPVYRRRPYS